MGLTVIEMEYLRSQISMAHSIEKALPQITDALKRIATALEQDITADIETLDQHFLSVIEMQTGITKDGVRTKETNTDE